MASGEAHQTPEERIAALESALAESQAALAESQAAVVESRELIVLLQKQVADLTERLGRNSKNSHLPPSSDGPGSSKRGSGLRGKAGKRKRGGQKGRKGAKRELLDPSAVDEIVDFFPEVCLGCATELPKIPDPGARRTQQVELVDYGPWTTEYRRHEVACPCCGKKTRAAYDPDKIPASAFGPRLTSVVVLLTGVHHISRVNTAQLIDDLFGISISVGTISAMEARATKALKPVHEEIKRVVDKAAVKYADGTTWLREGEMRSLWTVSSSLATLYEILQDGTQKTISPLFGALIGILVSDRASVFGFWVMAMRQICWAHLVRKFVAFSERDGPGGDVGRELLECAGLVFEYWHAFCAGRFTRDELIVWMRPVRLHVESVLERAAIAGIEHVSGSCANMLEHRDALWTFVTHEGVEPTNNDAERELRPLVLWRKRSFGSKSDRGEQFVARVMSVARTARKQGKAVLNVLEQALVALLHRRSAPRLVEAC